MSERKSFLEPGYDCRKECTHPIKGDHGICGDRWIYVVIDGAQAVSLSVLSHHYPATVDMATLPSLLQTATGEVLAFHAPPAASEESGPCDYVSGGRCVRGAITYLGAKSLWEAHGDSSQQEQPEALWLALEEQLDALKKESTH